MGADYGHKAGKVRNLYRAPSIKPVFYSRVRRGTMGLLQDPLRSPLISRQVAGIESLTRSADEQTIGLPLRQFQRHDVKVSALGFRGHHPGEAENVQVAMRLVQRAVSKSITL